MKNRKFILFFKKDVVLLSLIFVITSLVFFPVFKTGFLSYDFYAVYKAKTSGFSFNYYSHIKNKEDLKNLKNKGLIPYYTNENVRKNFLKPLTSAAVYGLYLLFGTKETLYSLFCFLIYVLTAALLFYLLKEFFDKLYAALGAFIFAISKTNTDVAGRVYYLYEVLALIFIISALLYFIKYRRKEEKKYIVLSFVFCILAFLSSEGGVLSFVFVLSYDFFINTKSSIKEYIKNNKGMVSLFIAALFCYTVFYFTFSYGARSLAYISVLSPLKYLVYLPKTLVMNFLSLFLYMPQRLYSPQPLSGQISLLIVSVFLLIIVLSGIYFNFRKERKFKFFFLWLLCPMLLWVSYNRDISSLFISAPAFAALCVLLLSSVFKKCQSGYLKKHLLNLSTLIVFICITASPLYTRYMLLRNYRISKVYKTSSESIKKALGGRLLSWKKTLIVLNHRNRYTLRGFNYALFLYTKLKFISFNIINENFGAKIVRADDKTLTISADRIYSASLFASGFNHELEFLLSRSFNTGDIFENKNFKVYISEVKDNLPVKITVETKEALSSDKTAFVRFNPLLNKYEIKNFTPEGLFR